MPDRLRVLAHEAPIGIGWRKAGERSHATIQKALVIQPGTPWMGAVVHLSESRTSEVDVQGLGIVRVIGAEPEKLL